jgi:uncharacterized coiled-coil DUF342 family protein
MQIDEKIISDERESLKKDFDTINTNIKKMENDLKTLRNNLNAVYGAIQQCDKFLTVLKENKGDKEMPKKKQEALTLATS